LIAIAVSGRLTNDANPFVDVPDPSELLSPPAYVYSLIRWLK
jgi:hypothetical protein